MDSSKYAQSAGITAIYRGRPECPRQIENLPDPVHLRDQKIHVLKIITAVCKDLRLFFPEVIQPSPWIIDALIECTYQRRGNRLLSDDLSWLYRVDQILSDLLVLTHENYCGPDWFSLPISAIPVFPNSEGFTIRHAHGFISAAHRMLDDAHTCLIS